MADRTTLLQLAALRRALAEPGGLPLHGKAPAALFPSSALGKQAAQRCLDDGLLRPLDNDGLLHVLGERGLDWLLHQTSSRTVLDDLVRALEARQNESAALVAAARRMQDTLAALQRADQVLKQLPAEAPPAWQEDVIAFLEGRQVAEDCPLPQLYRQASEASPGLTIGGFHDGLRELCEEGRIYLHPWTGPLYALPEPPFALLIGHEIAYYASPRRDQPLAA